jgi:ring-1,2-phenylacetyl-CoA epoxidase subunit PaaB
MPRRPSLHGVRRVDRDDPVNTYEVFLKRDGKEEFRHAGSLEAADADLAVVLARETYVRRAEGDQLWLVDRRHVVDVDAAFLAPNADKPHRHNDGSRVAERRRAQRDQ